MNQSIPNSPQFRAGRAWNYDNVDFHKALLRSNLNEFFSTSTFSYTEGGLLGPMLFGLDLLRALGRGKDGTTRWYPLARITPDDNDTALPFLSIARFLETAIHSRLIVVERAPDGSPWVRLCLKEAATEFDLFPKFIAEPYLAKLQEDERERSEQLERRQRVEIATKHRLEELEQSILSREKERSRYVQLGDVVRDALAGRSPWTELNIAVYCIDQDMWNGRKSAALNAICCGSDEGVRMYVENDSWMQPESRSQKSPSGATDPDPFQGAYDRANFRPGFGRLRVCGNSTIGKKAFEDLLQPLFNCSISGRRPARTDGAPHKEVETIIRFGYCLDGRPTGNDDRQCSVWRDINIIGKRSTTGSEEWTVDDGWSEWRIDCDGVWLVFAEVLRGLARDFVPEPPADPSKAYSTL